MSAFGMSSRSSSGSRRRRASASRRLPAARRCPSPSRCHAVRIANQETTRAKAPPRRPGSIRPPPPRRSTPPPPRRAPGRDRRACGRAALPPGPGVPTTPRRVQRHHPRRSGARPRRAPPADPNRGGTVNDVSRPRRRSRSARCSIRPRSARPPAKTGRPTTAPTTEPGNEVPPQNQHTASVPPLTPTPAGVRHSYADDLLEPRFSNAASTPGARGRPVDRRHGPGGDPGPRRRHRGAQDADRRPGQAGRSDARIGALLADGEKSIAFLHCIYPLMTLSGHCKPVIR